MPTMPSLIAASVVGWQCLRYLDEAQECSVLDIIETLEMKMFPTPYSNTANSTLRRRLKEKSKVALLVFARSSFQMWRSMWEKALKCLLDNLASQQCMLISGSFWKKIGREEAVREGPWKQSQIAYICCHRQEAREGVQRQEWQGQWHGLGK